ncbi:MAG: GTP pyrophosphokinase [Gammaproteobacteria bacterium]
MAFDSAAFDKLYDAELPRLTEAARQVEQIVQRVIAGLGDRDLVRARIVDEVRIKSRESLARKAREHSWETDEVFQRVPDAVGARLVCANLEDVPRAVELLRQAMQQQGVDVIEETQHEPDASGYRATHLTFRVDLWDPKDHFLLPSTVGCEIQVRTSLQDAWARLSHQDLYKQERVPREVADLAGALADLLHGADRLAQQIRAAMARERAAPLARPALDRVTEQGVAYLYRATFGRDPSEWVLTAMQQACTDAGITSLEPVEATLGDRGFRERVRASAPGTISNEDLFLVAPVAAVRGVRAAMGRLRAKAARQRREAARTWRREVLSSLPATLDEFLESDLEVDHLQQLAHVLGATTECAVCDAGIVDADEFAAQLARHYRLDEPDDRVRDLVWNSGVETGDFDNPSLCSYHGHVMSKDD